MKNRKRSRIYWKLLAYRIGKKTKTKTVTNQVSGRTGSRGFRDPPFGDLLSPTHLTSL